MNKSFQFNTVLILEIPSCHVHLQKSIYFVTNTIAVCNEYYRWYLQ